MECDILHCFLTVVRIQKYQVAKRELLCEFSIQLWIVFHILGEVCFFRVWFLDLVNVKGTWVQEILFVDAGGDIYVAQYPMERQADGNWLIDGCMLTRQGDKSI